MFSRRTDHDREPNEVSRALDAARAAGTIRVDLTVSNPTRLGLGFDDASLHAAFAGVSLDRYDPDARGSEETRAAFGRVLGVPADDVLLTASTSEAYAHLFAILADPGDRVLVPRPSYPLLEWLARLSGATLVPYDLAYDGEWFLDRSSFADALAAPAKAIVAIHPNNPTGSFTPREELELLASQGLPLIVDEVFAQFPLESVAPAPFVPESGLVFRLTGLSKLCASPQMKVGCIGICGERSLVDEARARLELVADTFLSVSGPSDRVAGRLLTESAAIRERIVARCRRNLGSLDRILRGSPASRLRVDAGWCVIVRMPSIATEAEWALMLLERGVAVQPGWFYDLSSGTHLVLSLLAEPSAFEAGAETIARLVSHRDSSR